MGFVGIEQSSADEVVRSEDGPEKACESGVAHCGPFLYSFHHYHHRTIHHRTTK